MKKLQKIIGKFVNVIIVLVIIAIIICVYSVFSIKVLHKNYVNFFGYSIFEVATGSMKEEINVGDAVLVKINDDFDVGDIITYKNGDSYITHRVVLKNNNQVITKGDANNVNDNPIDTSLVLGKVVKILPKVGVWKKVLLTPKVIIMVLLTLFVFSILFSYEGKSIKIVSSSKAQKEIDNKIEDEVNKKVAVINRRKKRVKKVLDATQIIDLNEINSRLKEKDITKNVEVTQILDLDEIDAKVHEANNGESLEATQILDLDDIIPKDNKKLKKKKSLDATQILDISEINKINNNSKKKKTLDATQIIDVSSLKRK